MSHLVGAPLSGRLSDRIILFYRKKRGSEWYPEDRLRAALPGALFLVPLSILISGLLTEYVPGPLGLGLNLLCLFANGMGVNFQSFILSLFGTDIELTRSILYSVHLLLILLT